MLSRKKCVRESRKKLSRDSAINLASDFYHGWGRNARLFVRSRSIRGGLPMSAFLMFGVSPRFEVSGGSRRQSPRRDFSEDALKKAHQIIGVFFSGVQRSKRLQDALAPEVFAHRSFFHSIKSSIHSFLAIPVCFSFFISTPDGFLFTNFLVAKFFQQSRGLSDCWLAVCSC